MKEMGLGLELESSGAFRFAEAISDFCVANMYRSRVNFGDSFRSICKWVACGIVASSRLKR